MAGTTAIINSSSSSTSMLTSLQQQQEESSSVAAVQLSSNLTISPTLPPSAPHLLLFSFNESILWGLSYEGSSANHNNPHHHQLGMAASNGSESNNTTIADYYGLSSSNSYYSAMAVGNEIEQFELVGKSCQHFLESLYSLTAFAALGGNFMTILVLALGRRSSRDLRFFLGNLALSDISMAAFSIPFTYTNFILGRWIWAPSWCPVVHAMQHVAVFVSIWTLVSIGVERYLNVTFLFRRLMPKTPVIIILIWLVGAALGTFVYVRSEAEPWTLVTTVATTTGNSQHSSSSSSSTTSSLTINQTLYDCLERWENEADEGLFTVCLFLAVFALPLGILLFVYGSICYKLWHHSAPGNPHAIRDSAQSKAKIKSIKMLITICVLFAICWGPTHFFQLLRVLWRAAFDWLFKDSPLRQAPLSGQVYIGICITVHWMSMANSVCNPIVYCYMSDNFRADLKSIIRKYFTSRSSPSMVVPGGGGSQGGTSSACCCCLSYLFCCCWCRKQTPAHRLTASTLVIEQLMLNSGGGKGVNGADPMEGNQRNTQRNNHATNGGHGHFCNGNGLHLHFAAGGSSSHNNTSDWYPMTAMPPPPPPPAATARSNGLILQTAHIGGGGGGGNGSLRSISGGGGQRDQPIIEFRNGRAIKFKMKRASAPASAPASSSGGGGGNDGSGTSTSGGGAETNKARANTAKKCSKSKRTFSSSSSAKPYVYERNKWSRRSNTSRGGGGAGGGGNGNGGSSSGSSGGGGGSGVPRSATLNCAHLLNVVGKTTAASSSSSSNR